MNTPKVPCPTVQLRLAVIHDARILWAWRNDPVTLAQSFDTASVSWQTHFEWLSNKLGQPESCCIWIAEAEGQPIGQVRFERDTADTAVVSVSVDSAWRGLGLGSSILAQGSAMAFSAIRVTEIIAWIKLQNNASRRAFLHAGYLSAPATLPSGEACWRMMLAPKHRKETN